MASRVVIILMLLCTIIPMTPATLDNTQKDSVQLKQIYNNTDALQEIKFWRANGVSLNISDSQIFPMASMGANGIINNLGLAWITWIIEVEGYLVPAHAIYEKGGIRNFEMDDGYYLEVFWKAVGDNLVLITSTAIKTKVTLFTIGSDPVVRSFDFYSNQHELYVTETYFQIFLMKNGTMPTNLVQTGYLLIEQATENILLSSIPNAALFQLNSSELVFTYNDLFFYMPEVFSNSSVVGHIFQTPTVFDLENKQAWIEGDIIDLPDNITRLHFFGLKSSILEADDGTLYEIGLNGWVKFNFSDQYHPQSLAIVDIGLYFGTYVHNGLHIIAIGDDEDGDHAPDTLESYYFSSVYEIDTDLDTIPDQIEIAFGLNPLLDDRFEDYDNDLITNIDELNLGLDPNLADSDFAGAKDGWEFMYGFDPLNGTDDTKDIPDQDGVPNNIESDWNTSPMTDDTDSDKMPDFWEILYNFDPTDASDAMLDHDGDSYNNLYEYEHNMDPLLPDPRPIFSGLGWWILGSVLLATPIAKMINKRVLL
ncbi:MAG: hypothetical protein INQ03_07685 [Candidatus Heimdallarchaeota archaeon]|nr:hypothetical protein [Candidatus Heimdallarchaeota archaeon]